MKELNVNLKQSANYLIQFFYKTEKRYSCTRTKIGKLLSILAFKHARDDEKLFDEIIYRYPPCCGTLIKELTYLLPRDIYTRDISPSDSDNSQYITEGYTNCIIIPEQYQEIDSLPESIKEEIEKVFKTFGAYPASELGSLLNPIVDQIIIDGTDKTNLTKFDNAVLDFDNNQIANYICKQ